MSHNSDGRLKTLSGDAPGQGALPFRLTGSQSKTAFALRQNVERLIGGNAKRSLKLFTDPNGHTWKHWVCAEPENLNSCVFLTLTVGDYTPDGFKQIWDASKSSRRFNNAARRLLKDMFDRCIVVTERHKNRAIHFHLVGLLKRGADGTRPDIRTGINWAEIEAATALSSQGKRPPGYLYRSGSDELKEIWKILRERLPGLGFGRAECLPIRKTSEAVACYVSKYIEKNLCNRLKDDYRKKLVRYIGWEKSQLKPNEFGWASERATAWRAKTIEAAALIDCYSPQDAAAALGPRWAFHISGTWQKACENLTPRLTCSWGEKQIIRRDLAKLAGSEWCKKAHNRQRINREMCGEVYDVPEWREYWNSVGIEGNPALVEN